MRLSIPLTRSAPSSAPPASATFAPALLSPTETSHRRWATWRRRWQRSYIEQTQASICGGWSSEWEPSPVSGARWNVRRVCMESAVAHRDVAPRLLDPAERDLRQRDLDSLRAAVDEDALATFFAEGQALTLDAAIALARQELGLREDDPRGVRLERAHVDP